MVKNLSTMQIPSVGQEDPLEKGMVTHSSILAWRVQGQSGLAVPQGYSPQGCKEPDMTEVTQHTQVDVWMDRRIKEKNEKDQRWEWGGWGLLKAPGRSEGTAG